MKSNSIQFKFLVIIISAILAVAVIIGGMSIYEVDKYIQAQSKDLVSTMCSNEVSQINDTFGDMEKSVRIMESYVLSFFNSYEEVTQPENRLEVTEVSERLFADVAMNTNGVIAYYLRFDPSISDGTSGLFYSKTVGGSEYVRFEPTDISIYDKNDIEHVGWFWKPYEAGEPMWMDPYFNKNNGIFMVSYVVPLYCENQFIGVVGMDFDYDVLTERVHQIKIYENGFAHLERDGVVLHSSQSSIEMELPADYSDQYFTVSQDLFNGMSLVMFASYNDIQQIRFEIALRILFFVLALSLVFVLIVIFMVRKIVKPLKKLTDAAIKLAGGDYDVDIVHGDTYEIDLLSTAFENMAMNLREHEKQQHLLAYRDALTGVKNTASFKKWIVDFDERIKSGNISFGVTVFDINYLKEANDTYGHNAGNSLIIAASQVICRTFKRSPVFRIGGDEFLAILQNQDLEERNQLFELFYSECAGARADVGKTTIPVSVAMGFSLFDPENDPQFLDVFNRADSKMYENKKKMKLASRY